MFENPFLEFVARFYSWVIRIGSGLQSLFLLLLRIMWGQQFFMIGLAKILRHKEVALYFTSIGLPHPEFHTYFIGFLEIVGGACLVLGFASRLASIPLIFIMFGALIAHHVLDGYRFIENPFLLAHSGPFPFLLTSLIVFIFGPGRISIDGWIKRNSRHWRQL